VQHAVAVDLQQPTFRVCADPNNMPFSNQRQQGFENKLAQLLATQMSATVAYSWWAQRRGYVRNTLKAGLCDAIMGVPTELDVVETTHPYYRSSYVFVSRADRDLDLAAMTDPRLKRLRIGIQLIGNGGFNTPPAHALGEQGIIDNVVGFPVYGDYRQPNPAALIVQAVEEGRIDLAAVWGPLGGYLAKKSAVPLHVEPITDTERFKPLQFQFDISMGVRKGDHALKARLDDIIARLQSEIDQLLESYGVPLVRDLGHMGLGSTPVRSD
jgi:quinoprotein dehydrogenase-associated probable ABC transporter substrate-binding protein